MLSLPSYIFYIVSSGVCYLYFIMEFIETKGVLPLGEAIELMKFLAQNFKDTGDYLHIFEILAILDDIDAPSLIEFGYDVSNAAEA